MKRDEPPGALGVAPMKHRVLKAAPDPAAWLLWAPPKASLRDAHLLSFGFVS